MKVLRTTSHCFFPVSHTPLSYSFSFLRHNYIEFLLRTHATSSRFSLSVSVTDNSSVLHWQHTFDSNTCIWYPSEACVVINSHIIFHAATFLKAKESLGLNVKKIITMVSLLLVLHRVSHCMWHGEFPHVFVACPLGIQSRLVRHSDVNGCDFF